MTSKDFEVDRCVLYVPHHAHGDVGHKDVERGVVTSTNDTYVFVRFGSHIHSQACSPSDLRYEIGA